MFRRSFSWPVEEMDRDGGVDDEANGDGDLDGEGAPLLVVEGPVHGVQQEQPANLQDTSHKAQITINTIKQKPSLRL